MGIRKKTLSGARGADGGAGGAAGGATAAFSEDSSSSSSFASSAARAASRAALAFASCNTFVFSSGRMAGCRMANNIPALAPNFKVLGETIVKTVFTTTPNTILTKNRVTTSTYTSAHAAAKMTSRKPAVTRGSSQLNTPATRSSPPATSSSMDCDNVIIANTSSICFCSAAKGLSDSQLKVSFGASALAFSAAAFSAARFFSRSSFFCVSFASRSSLDSFKSSFSSSSRALTAAASSAFSFSSRSRFTRSSSSVGGANGRPCESHSSACARSSTRWYRPGNCARDQSAVANNTVGMSMLG